MSSLNSGLTIALLHILKNINCFTTAVDLEKQFSAKIHNVPFSKQNNIIINNIY
jgi:hypothetical protein